MWTDGPLDGTLVRGDTASVLRAEDIPENAGRTFLRNVGFCLLLSHLGRKEYWEKNPSIILRELINRKSSAWGQVVGCCMVVNLRVP
jgi:hypothetical protein